MRSLTRFGLRWLEKLEKCVMLNQTGDTLVEVMIALTILAAVLASAFVVSNRVTRMGLASRERTQAINLLQEQAEALRSYRDSGNWANFQSAIPAGVFHMEPSGNGWVPVGGIVTDPSVPAIFLDPSFNRGVYITVTSGLGTDTYDLSITAKWENPGGGVDNQTTVYTRLVNLDGLAPS